MNVKRDVSLHSSLIIPPSSLLFQVFVEGGAVALAHIRDAQPDEVGCAGAFVVEALVARGRAADLDYGRGQAERDAERLRLAREVALPDADGGEDEREAAGAHVARVAFERRRDGLAPPAEAAAAGLLARARAASSGVAHDRVEVLRLAGAQRDARRRGGPLPNLGLD